MQLNSPGGTNEALDLQNPDNLGAQSTDNGLVVNLKWSFSNSKTRLLNGGWTRESVVTDLPASKDIAGAQQHLTKGSYRELHWHRVAEWGFVYEGEVLLSAVDPDGKNQVAKLTKGDYWYFPKGAAHGIQGLADQNEYLLVFDDGNFDAGGTTFMVDDWIAHTPRSILAQNFGVNESVFDTVPKTDPYSKLTSRFVRCSHTLTIEQSSKATLPMASRQHHHSARSKAMARTSTLVLKSLTRKLLVAVVPFKSSTRRTFPSRRRSHQRL